VRSARYVAAISLAVLVCGCTDMNTFVRPDLPDSLGGKGAVIAEVHGIGLNTSFMDVSINHRTGGVRVVNVSMSDVLSFPLERHFTVRAGEITNLGELVLLRDPRTPDSKEFVVRTVDNNADAHAFLQSHYPKLLASIKSEAPTLAPGDYVRGAELEQLRVYIASMRANQLRGSHYVTGPAGTLASVEHDKSGKPTRVHLIDFGAAAGIVDVAEQFKRDRFAFQTSDGRLFVVNGGHVLQRPLPEGTEQRAGLSADELHLAGDRNIVIVERGLDLFVSADDGLTWRHESGGPANPGAYSTTGFGANDSGYYVFQSYPPRVLYSPMGEPNLQPVVLPPPVTELRRITALNAALVLEGFVGAFAKVPEPFFVRASNAGDWQQRLKPNAQACQAMQFLDQKAERLRTVCGTAVYASTDGGEHWEIQPQG
jgi:hypothetical protein